MESAIESNSIPNRDSICNNLAVLPSKASNKAAIIIRVPAFMGSPLKINPNDIEDIVVGCAFQVGEQCFNIGKLVTFLTGMDIKTSGMSVD